MKTPLSLIAVSLCLISACDSPTDSGAVDVNAWKQKPDWNFIPEIDTVSYYKSDGTGVRVKCYPGNTLMTEIYTIAYLNRNGGTVPVKYRLDSGAVMIDTWFATGWNTWDASGNVVPTGWSTAGITDRSAEKFAGLLTRAQSLTFQATSIDGFDYTYSFDLRGGEQKIARLVENCR